ncbi:MAG: internalin, partial [Actinobacteria bacterium]|nr:internalin [Actinomycetota bacterium]
MRRTGQKRNSILSIFAIALSTLTFLVGNVPMANAQLKGVTLDFAAAEPTSYNHLVGGGRWNSGILNTDIARSLAGSQFKCGDIVSYLSKFEMDASNSITSIEPFTISSEFNFDLDTTGQSGAILGDVLAVSIDPSDSAQRGNGNSVATLISETASGPIFTKGSVLSAVVEVSNLEQNEVVVVRMDVKIFCDPKLNPTGNLQALFKDAKLTFKNGSTPVSPAEPLNQGAKTVPMKELGALAIPQLSLVKTVTTGSCPGVKSLTV